MMGSATWRWVNPVGVHHGEQYPRQKHLQQGEPKRLVKENQTCCRRDIDDTVIGNHAITTKVSSAFSIELGFYILDSLMTVILVTEVFVLIRVSDRAGVAP
jgi:hypothetical protein